MTHSFSEMEVSRACYDEIETKLRQAGYGHAFVDGAIDMYGIGLVAEEHPQHGWTPTAENINNLPAPLRDYIRDLEGRCDPAGDVAAIAHLRENQKALEYMVREEKARVRELEDVAEQSVKVLQTVEGGLDAMAENGLVAAGSYDYVTKAISDIRNSIPPAAGDEDKRRAQELEVESGSHKGPYKALSMPESCQIQEDNRKLIAALQRIARGRVDCGKPLAGAAAREAARGALLGTGNDFGIRAMQKAEGG